MHQLPQHRSQTRFGPAGAEQRRTCPYRPDGEAQRTWSVSVPNASMLAIGAGSQHTRQCTPSYHADRRGSGNAVVLCTDTRHGTSDDIERCQHPTQRRIIHAPFLETDLLFAVFCDRRRYHRWWRERRQGSHTCGTTPTCGWRCVTATCGRRPTAPSDG